LRKRNFFTQKYFFPLVLALLKKVFKFPQNQPEASTQLTMIKQATPFFWTRGGDRIMVAVPKNYRKKSLLLAWIVLFFSGTHKALGEDWKKIEDNDGIVVYMKQPSKDGTISVRGEGILNYSPQVVFSILENSKRANQWMPLVKERRTLEQIDENSRIEFTHIGLPWPLKDRYFIDTSRLDKNPQDGSLTISLRSVPNPNKKWLVDDKVLGFLHYSELKLIPMEQGKKTRLTIEVNTDPRGDIPLFLVNLQQRQWPKKFIEGLKGELEKDLLANSLAH
jgi:hypothetical protein